MWVVLLLQSGADSAGGISCNGGACGDVMALCGGG